MTTPITGALTSAVPYTGNIALDALLAPDTVLPFMGVKWGGALGTGVTVDFSFPTSPVNPAAWDPRLDVGYGTAATMPDWEPWKGFHSLDSVQQQAVRDALQAWSNVANIAFQEVPDSATQVGDIRVAFTTGGQMDSGTYAYTYLPASNAPYAGDVWLNSVAPVSTANIYTPGGNGAATLLHELGHAIGLDHTFSLGEGTFPDGFDTMQYSIMSYSDYDPLGFGTHFDDGFSSFYPTTPMLYDIQAVQYLYGANLSYHAGTDTYLFYEGESYYQTLWDAGGTDTLQYLSVTDGAVIDLNAGHFSRLGNTLLHSDGTPQEDNVAIAFNVTLENAIGGGGSDHLIGNAVANVLTGNGGDDTLDGGAGIDTLDGGQGNDTYVLADDDSLADSGGIDTVVTPYSRVLGADFENLQLIGFDPVDGTGNAADNRITGNGAINILDGGAGNDTLAGGEGSDIYYVSDTGDVVIETATPWIDAVFSSVSFALGAGLDNLTLTGSAPINGSGNSLANAIVGNDAANVLRGGVGADTLTGGGGDDTYVADGSDVLIEGGAGGRDAVVLKGGTLALGAGIEDLALGPNALSFVVSGNALDNRIEGNRFSNALSGGEGNDTLEGGAGSDVLVGGAGADTFVLLEATRRSHDTIRDFTPGVDHLALGPDIGFEDVRYDGAAGVLYYAPEQGAGHEYVLAVLSGAPELSESDFALL